VVASDPLLRRLKPLQFSRGAADVVVTAELVELVEPER
jgi:hypothetical protein